MIEALSSSAGAAGAMGPISTKVSSQDVADFSAMMNQGGPVNQSLVSFVEGAQSKLDASEKVFDSKLKDFDTKDKVINLIEAMHESSMRSVSVQLTGKIGSKVSEGFEQLVKQQ